MARRTTPTPRARSCWACRCRSGAASGSRSAPLTSCSSRWAPSRGDAALAAALGTWRSASADQQAKWAGAYADALAKAPDSDPAKVGSGDFGPVPVLAKSFLGVVRSGGLEGQLTSSGNFYGGDQTRALLLLSDGAYLEDTRAPRTSAATSGA